MISKKDRVIIHITQIEDNGITIEKTLPASLLDLADDDYFHEKDDVKIEIKVKKVDGNVLAKGKIETSVTSECTRCLADFGIFIAIPDYCEYFDEFDDQIDLTDSIRETILLAFPPKPLCKEECFGICSICGANLNSEECNCEEDQFINEDDDESNNVWGCLDHFNLQDDS